MVDRRRSLGTLITALALALAVSACSGATTDSDQGATDGAGGYEKAVTHDPYVVGDAALTDTEGQPYSLTADTTKPLTLVFFGYTHCPDICPQVLSQLASGLTRLDKADRDRVDVVFVTSDPARDTSKVLGRYLARFDPTFIGLTGDLATIAALGKPLAVFVDQGEKLPTGGYDLNSHSSQVSAITADDTSPLLWTQDASSAQFAADIHTLLQKVDS